MAEQLPKFLAITQLNVINSDGLVGLEGLKECGQRFMGVRKQGYLLEGDASPQQTLDGLEPAPTHETRLQFVLVRQVAEYFDENLQSPNKKD